MEGSGRMTILVIKNMNLDRKLLDNKEKRSMMTYKSINTHIVDKNTFIKHLIFRHEILGLVSFKFISQVTEVPEKCNCCWK